MPKVVAILVALAAAGVCYTQTTRPAAPPPRSIWMGVYTDAQADRGEALYPDCARCHGDDLEGDEGPALTGDDFLKDWKGMSLGDLFKRIHESMPLDHPGSITLEQTADLTAFILRNNNAPPGQTPMSTNLLMLKQIRMDK